MDRPSSKKAGRLGDLASFCTLSCPDVWGFLFISHAIETVASTLIKERTSTLEIQVHATSFESSLFRFVPAGRRFFFSACIILLPYCS